MPNKQINYKSTNLTLSCHNVHDKIQPPTQSHETSCIIMTCGKWKERSTHIKNNLIVLISNNNIASTRYTTLKGIKFGWHCGWWHWWNWSTTMSRTRQYIRIEWSWLTLKMSPTKGNAFLRCCFELYHAPLLIETCKFAYQYDEVSKNILGCITFCEY